MQPDLLLSAIARHISLTAEEQQQLIAVLSFKKVKKKQFLYQEGDITKQAVFVIAGCLRSYSIDKNGFEHILQFAPPGWWISDMRSMITQEPGTLYIDAVDDSEIILIQKNDLDKLYAAIPKLERFFRILAENSLATYQHRLIDNLSLSALERYGNFCKRYPSLIENLPQKQVAAYIGVTPEFLSKMLNKVPAKK
ncbi:Crp/Fnr family transcriptional regulator [Ferruginibacter sp. SUN106]|uniref:Crp/Fnr family transcriptional regulator n=1 Tax=Ferruginibacter sp. SUN106 TaxID=2978348 RepID=UPI003D36BBA0